MNPNYWVTVTVYGQDDDEAWIETSDTTKFDSLADAESYASMMSASKVEINQFIVAHVYTYDAAGRVVELNE